MDGHQRDIIIRATVDRALELSGALAENNQRALELRQEADAQDGKSKQVMEQINTCYATAGLFGFNLDDEVVKFLTQANPFYGPPQASPPLVATQTETEKPTIQDFILTAAEKAFPFPVKAASLRIDLGKVGIQTHPKSVGMTLYRLSKKGLLKRRGKDEWFLVPGNERETAQAGDAESSGLTPELHLDAN